MQAKFRAVPLPPLGGRRVLDVGCDMGAWSFHAAEQGAAVVHGLDRNRVVRDYGLVDLIGLNESEARRRALPQCAFSRIDLGKQWHLFGAFDVLLVFSVYHHIYENCGDHDAVWFWLHRHCARDGIALWEGPVDDHDPVVRANVSPANRTNYTRDRILAAAARYFDAEHIGPALHEPTREVWRFRPKPVVRRPLSARIVSGAGGAATAFRYAGDRRIGEIETILGFRPFPGSLNLQCGAPFWFAAGAYRAQLLDVADRVQGLASEWLPRWARFTPLEIDGHQAVAFRFEGERYPQNFVELIAPVRLRDVLAGRDEATLC